MAQKLKEEDLRLNLIINGDSGKKQILEMTSTVDDLGKKLEKAKKELAGIDAGLRPQGYENAKKEVDALNAAYKTASDRLQSLQRQQKLETMTMGELQRHIRTTSAALKNAVPGTENWKSLGNELKKSKERMRELRDAANGTGAAMSKLSRLRVGSVAAIAAIAGAVRAVASRISGAISTMADFEQANVNLSTILGMSVDSISDLTSEAERLGATTRYTASQVTGLQTELAKLGFTKGQIKAMEEPVLHFATAVGSELPEAAAMAGATLRMFGLSAKDADDTLGALAVATNKSALNFTYLQTAMSIVGPVANTFGFSVKDTTALLGSLANAGFDASSAATATRNILLNLADSNGKLAKALGGPISTFPELIDGLKQLNDKGVDLATTLDLTDKRSVSAFNQLLRGADDAYALRDALEDTGGELKRIADERMNTLSGSVLQLKSAWEGLILAFKDSTGPMKSVVDWLTKILTKTREFLNQEKDLNETAVHGLATQMDAIFRTQGEEGVQAFFASRKKAIEDGIKQEKSRGFLSKMWNTGRAEIRAYENDLTNLEAAFRRFREEQSPTPTSDTTTTTTTTTGGSGGDDGSKKKTWSLESDAAYLRKKAELMRSFNAGEIQSEKELNEQLYQAEVQAYRDRLASLKDSGSDRAKFSATLEKTILDHNKKALDEAKKAAKEVADLEKAAMQVYASVTEDIKAKASIQTQAENARFAEEKAKYEKQKDNLKNYHQIVETLEKQHQVNLRKIQLDAYTQERAALEKDHKIRLADIEAEYAYELNLETTSQARKEAIRREMAEKTTLQNKTYLFTLLKELTTITRTGMIEGQKLSNEQLREYEAQLAAVRKQFAETMAKADNLAGKGFFTNLGNMLRGTGDGSLFGVSQKDWEQFFANLRNGTMKASDLGNALNAIGGMTSEGMALARKAVELTNAKEQQAFDAWNEQNDEKKKSLEKRLDAGRISQAQYDAEIERMEKERQAMEDDMKTKQAAREKKLSLSEAIINTAQGVTKTYAQWGWPWGLIPATIMAAMGAAQIAMINSTPVGYAGGGPVKVARAQDGRQYRAAVDPDRRGYINRPTILVGEEGGEYVIPADGVRNPTLAPAIASIEAARRQGTLRNFNFAAVRPAVAYARGGATASTSSPATVVYSDPELLAMVKALNKRLEDPIFAYTTMTGPNGIVEQTKKYNRQKKVAGQLGG